MDASRFRWLLWLCVPLVCFAVAYFAGYLMHSAFSGYAAEVMQGHPTGEKALIVSAVEHFKDDYLDCIQSLSMVQFCATFLGIVGIVVMYLCLIANLRSRRRMK